MFTDRFIKIPIKVFDAKAANLTNTEGELFDCWMKINPFEISHYKPSFADDDNVFRHTYVYMKSGESFYAYIHIDEFEKLLNNHNNT